MTVLETIGLIIEMTLVVSILIEVVLLISLDVLFREAVEPIVESISEILVIFGDILDSFYIIYQLISEIYAGVMDLEVVGLITESIPEIIIMISVEIHDSPGAY